MSQVQIRNRKDLIFKRIIIPEFIGRRAKFEWIQIQEDSTPLIQDLIGQLRIMYNIPESINFSLYMKGSPIPSHFPVAVLRLSSDVISRNLFDRYVYSINPDDMDSGVDVRNQTYTIDFAHTSDFSSTGLIIDDGNCVPPLPHSTELSRIGFQENTTVNRP